MSLAVIGAGALWLTFVWLASAIIASQFSLYKGWGEKTGLITGVVGTVMGAFAWALWPAREVSRWNVHEGLTSTEKGILVGVEVLLLAAGAFVVATIDASSAGKIGLVVMVIMVAVIAAGIVKLASIAASTGGKTMAELRAERESAAAEA